MDSVRLRSQRLGLKEFWGRSKSTSHLADEETQVQSGQITGSNSQCLLVANFKMRILPGPWILNSCLTSNLLSLLQKKGFFHYHI